jgi:quinohemoprotein ethanol dehydrogenase
MTGKICGGAARILHLTRDACALSSTSTTRSVRNKRLKRIVTIVLTLALGLFVLRSGSAAILDDMANGEQWAGYGRTYDQKFAKVTWAQKIDLKTGRPVETPDARDESGKTEIWPIPPLGAHGPQPMAFNPTNRLVYIPRLDVPDDYAHKGNDAKFRCNSGMGSLLAWDPIVQRAAWRVSLQGFWNGGIATTGGNLVFQGRCDGRFAAYAADSGKELWSFDAGIGIAGSPITYRVAGRQYVSILAGFGGAGSILGRPLWDARTQPRRLLTFVLGGHEQLPSSPMRHEIVPVHDPKFQPDTKAEQSGAFEFDSRCAACHGPGAIAGGAAPDLRGSTAILSGSTFLGIVKRGALLEQGMPRFEDLRNDAVENIRQYLRSRAAELNRHRTIARPTFRSAWFAE